MSAESNFGLAEYFERRAKLERPDTAEGTRLLAIAVEYHAQATAERERQADQDLKLRPEQW
jgi:hypothetical protein